MSAWASNYMSIQLHEHINLQAYKYIVIQVCAHVDTKKGWSLTRINE